MTVEDKYLTQARRFSQWQVEAEFIDVRELRGIHLDLRYSDDNNFVGKDIYGPMKTAYLHQEAFLMLKVARDALKESSPHLDFLIFDALRPRSAQWVLFNKVKGTEFETYVADPQQGSVHNFGFAVDLSLCTLSGEEIDMGTGFDDFTDLAQPRYEEQFLASGQLTQEHIANREKLRSCMLQAGFQAIPNEWWHFNARPWQQLTSKYKIIE